KFGAAVQQGKQCAGADGQCNASERGARGRGLGHKPGGAGHAVHPLSATNTCRCTGGSVEAARGWCPAVSGTRLHHASRARWIVGSGTVACRSKTTSLSSELAQRYMTIRQVLRMILIQCGHLLTLCCAEPLIAEA